MKTGQENQKHPLILTQPCSFTEEASLALLCKHAFQGLYCSLVGMMQSTQHGDGDHLVRLMWWRSPKRLRIRDPLPDPLMWPSLITHQVSCALPGFEANISKDQHFTTLCIRDFILREPVTDTKGCRKTSLRLRHQTRTSILEIGPDRFTLLLQPHPELYQE
jgi:hypothetical protein